MNNYIDITKSGGLTGRDLQKLNNDEYSQEDNQIKVPQINDPILESFIRGSEYNREDVLRSLDQNYGKRKIDKQLALSELDYLNEARAVDQSGIEQVFNGVAKGAITAATTFADSFLGTLSGIAYIGANALAGNISSAGDVLNAFVDNPFSQLMQDINKASEEWLPNYYTEAEQEAPWYKSLAMNPANFIGDKFLKNAGFMVGAALSGGATAKLLTSATKLGKAKNVYKNMAANLGAQVNGKAFKADDVYKAYMRGEKTLDGVKLTEALANTAKQAKKADNTIKLISAVSGSVGESRIEAISGSDEKYNSQVQLIEQQRELEKQELFQHLLNSAEVQNNPKLFRNLFEKGSEDIDQKYDGALQQADANKQNYANASFLTNLILTSGAYYNLFGDAMVGGYKSARKFKDLIVKENNKFAVKSKGDLAKVIGKAALVPATEGTQEMFQEATVEGLNRYEGKRLNDYFGEGIDPDGLKASTDLVSTMLQAAGDQFSDIDNYESFVLGALTSAIPIPSRQTVVDKDGKKKTKVVASGELYDTIREYKDSKKGATAVAEALNDYTSDKDKVSFLYSLVRQRKYNEDQNKALDNNDVFEYKNQELNKLIDLVNTFEEAGRREELFELLEDAYTIESKDDIESVKSLTAIKGEDGKVGKSIYEDWTDEDITNKFKKDKEQVLKKVKQIQEISDSVNELYAGADKSYKQSLTSLIAQTDDRENRIKEVANEIMSFVNDNAAKLQKILDVPETLNTLKSILEFPEYFKNDYEKLQNLLERVQNKEEFKQIFNKLQKKKSKLTSLKNLKNQNKEAIQKQIEDVATTIEDLNNYVSKNTSKQSLDITPKLDDLFRLLVEREGLLNSLNSISKNPEEYKESLLQRIQDSYNSYVSSIYDKDYNKFAETLKLGDILNSRIPLDVALERAKKENNTSIINLLNNFNEVLPLLRKVSENEELQKNPIDLNLLYGYTMKFLEDNLDKNFSKIMPLLKTKLNSIDNPAVKEFLKLVNVYEKLNKDKAAKSTSKGGALNKGQIIEDDGVDNTDTDDDFSKYSDFAQYSEREVKMSSVEEAKEFIKNENIGDLINSVLKEVEEENDGQASGATYEDYDSVDALNELILNALNRVKENLETSKSKSKKDSEKETPEDFEDGSFTKPKKDIEKDLQAAQAEEDNEVRKEDAETPQNDLKAERENIRKAKDKITAKSTPKVTDPKKDEVSGDVVMSGNTKIINTGEKASGMFPKGNSESGSITTKGGKEEVWHANRTDSKYDIEALKDSKKRRAVELPVEDNVRREILSNNKAYEFIESGELARLAQFYLEKTGENLPVYIVQHRGASSISAGTESESQYLKNHTREEAAMILKNSLFLAVPIVEGFNPKEGKTLNYHSANSRTTTTLQLIGVLSAPKKNKENEAVYNNYQEVLTIVQDHVGNVKTMEGNQQPLVKTPWYTNLEFIYSGRLVKLLEGEDVVRERDLQDILVGNEKEGEGHFQISIITPKGEITFGKDLGGEVVNLNSFYSSSPLLSILEENRATRYGSVWIKTKEANGKVYYKRVNIKNFNSEYLENNKESPIVKKIKSAIENIITIKDSSQIAGNLAILSKYLYFPTGFYIDAANRKFIFNQNQQKGWSSWEISLDSKDAVDEILKGLATRNYRFSIGLDAKLSLKDIIESNIITSDIATLHNVNASFSVSPISFEKDKDVPGIYIQHIHPSETFKAYRADARSHIGKSEQDPSKNYGRPITVKIEGSTATYRLRGDNVWVKVNPKTNEEEQEVENENMITLLSALYKNELYPPDEKSFMMYTETEEIDGKTVKKTYRRYYIPVKFGEDTQYVFTDTGEVILQDKINKHKAAMRKNAIKTDQSKSKKAQTKDKKSKNVEVKKEGEKKVTPNVEKAMKEFKKEEKAGKSTEGNSNNEGGKPTEGNSNNAPSGMKSLLWGSTLQFFGKKGLDCKKLIAEYTSAELMEAYKKIRDSKKLSEPLTYNDLASIIKCK